MNKENAKGFLPYVQAMADGKTIQWKTDSGNWKDGVNLVFSLDPEDYRIKPEPRTFEIFYHKATNTVSKASKGSQLWSIPDWEFITVREVLE
jgi:hypothetical protein